jgi:hypothetical protein
MKVFSGRRKAVGRRRRTKPYIWGDVPTLSFIAPNQCNDQHGRGNAGPACDFDPNDSGSQIGQPGFDLRRRSGPANAGECNSQLARLGRGPKRDRCGVGRKLKTLEAGFALPCLNHACDAGVHVMSDLFSAR